MIIGILGLVASWFCWIMLCTMMEWNVYPERGFKKNFIKELHETKMFFGFLFMIVGFILLFGSLIWLGCFVASKVGG